MLSLALSICILAGLCGVGIASLPCQQFLVPSYIYPTGSSWDALCGIHGFIIINPSDGPGTSKNTDYVTGTAKAQASGTFVVGYVHSTYAAQPLSAVEHNISLYYEWYSVNGIFIDEASSESKDIAYYQTLYQYVKSKDSAPNKTHVIINPGEVPNIGYAHGCADIIVADENSESSYYSFNPGWTQNTSTVNISHIIYDVPDTANVVWTIDRSRSFGAQYIFLTDNDKYDHNPPYWQYEMKYVDTECAFR